jgi:alkanesulfonate monooxygenase SsuD/methylene tetrahydromethanopterin reductase-like flavin-dependent oxidoreductase (luciferase family)
MNPYPVTAELAEADRYARSHARDPGAPAHAVRCNVIVGESRCKKGDGHTDECEFAPLPVA